MLTFDSFITHNDWESGCSEFSFVLNAEAERWISSVIKSQANMESTHIDADKTEVEIVKNSDEGDKKFSPFFRQVSSASRNIQSNENYNTIFSWSAAAHPF